MATRVGSANGTEDDVGTVLSTGDNSPSTATVSVQAGDGIVVFGQHDGAFTAQSFSDNAAGGSNVYTPRFNNDLGGGAAQHTVATAIAKASETLTFTQSLADARSFRQVLVFVGRPGAGNVFVYDAATGSDGSSGAPSSGALTIAGQNGFAALGILPYNIVSYTPGSGWTEEVEFGPELYPYLAYRLLTNETSITGDATMTPSAQWSAIVAAFREEASGGGAPSRASRIARITRSIAG
jgi:hypothetical protein